MPNTKRVGDVVQNFPVIKKEDITAPFYIHDVDTFDGRYGGSYRVTCAYTDTPERASYNADASPNGLFLVLMAANDVRDQQMKQIADAFAGGTDALGPCRFQKVKVGAEGRETYNIIDADADAPAEVTEHAPETARRK